VEAFKVDLRRGSYTDPRAGRVLFRDRGEQWRAAQVHRATIAAQVETHLRRHVYPTFGDRPLVSIRPSEIQSWVRGLERDLAPSTIGVVYSFLAGVFRAAVRDRLIVTSPCVGIRLPKPEPKRIEPLATERVEALIEEMPARYRALIVLAAGTGLRQGEAFAVEVGAIDFLRRKLRVDQQLVLLPGGEPYVAAPKTPASYRTVPLPQGVPDRPRRDPGCDPQA
jgi:integrase